MAKKKPKSRPVPPEPPKSRLRGKGFLPHGGADLTREAFPRFVEVDPERYKKTKPTGPLRGTLINGPGPNKPNPNNKKGKLRGKGLPQQPPSGKLRGKGLKNKLSVKSPNGVWTILSK